MGNMKCSRISKTDKQGNMKCSRISKNFFALFTNARASLNDAAALATDAGALMAIIKETTTGRGVIGEQSPRYCGIRWIGRPWKRA